MVNKERYFILFICKRVQDTHVALLGDIQLLLGYEKEQTQSVKRGKN